VVSSTVALAAGMPGTWQTLDAHGVIVRYPPGWFATAQPLTPVDAPGQILAVASYPLPRTSAGAEGCMPREALEKMTRDGAFIFGWEYGLVGRGGSPSARDFPARPRHFRLTNLGNYECMGRSYMLRFRAAGRAVQIHIAFGARASAETRATTLKVMDSLIFQRR
jgi:hypothetical protein